MPVNVTHWTFNELTLQPNKKALLQVLTNNLGLPTMPRSTKKDAIIVSITLLQRLKLKPLRLYCFLVFWSLTALGRNCVLQRKKSFFVLFFILYIYTVLCCFELIEFQLSLNQHQASILDGSLA